MIFYYFSISTKLINIFDINILTSTLNFLFLVPPEDPIVLDGWGRPLNSTTIGPKEEGDDVTLTCRVIGG